MFRRNTLTPALIISRSSSGRSVAGPKVEMIFVLRIVFDPGGKTRKGNGLNRRASVRGSRGNRPPFPRGAPRMLAQPAAQPEKTDRTRLGLEFFARPVSGAGMEKALFFARIEDALPLHIFLAGEHKFHRGMIRVEQEHEGIVLNDLAARITHI